MQALSRLLDLVHMQAQQGCQQVQGQLAVMAPAQLLQPLQSSSAAGQTMQRLGHDVDQMLYAQQVLQLESEVVDDHGLHSSLRLI